MDCDAKMMKKQVDAECNDIIHQQKRKVKITIWIWFFFIDTENASYKP